MNRKQKLFIIVLAFVDLIVVGALLGTIITSQPESPTVTLIAIQVAPPTPLPNVPEWTATPTSTPLPTLLARPTRTATPTMTPRPTRTPTPTSTPAPIELVNGDFDLLMLNNIPGWQWDATINYLPGGVASDPATSYAEPSFTPADDPARRIHGSTLKIETIRWLKFQTWVYQTITVPTGSLVYFQIKASGFSSIDALTVKAGIDPNGNEGCDQARWGGETLVNQSTGIVTLTSPRVTVGAAGRATVCFFAEPRYPNTNNAAFFDQAELVVVGARP